MPIKRSTLVAAVVLAILAGIAYWLERGDGSSEDRDPVFAVSEEDIDRVEIRGRGGEPVVIQRDETSGSFRIVTPIDADTDASEVELLLSNLATMTAVRTIEDEVDLAELGLEPPRLEVRFATRTGDDLGIRFGNDTLTPSNQYAQRLGSSDVLVVGEHLSGNLDKTAWELRDKRVFPQHDEEVEPVRVAVDRADDPFVLSSESGVWRTATSPRARVDRHQVTGLVSRVRRAQMLELVDPETESGLNPPAHRLEVSFADDTISSIVLEIGDPRNIDYYARASPDRVFVIEGGLAEDIARGVDAYWSKTLIDSSPSDVTEIAIERGGEVRTLRGDEAQDLAGSLSSTRAEEVVATRPSSQAEMAMTIATTRTEERLFFHPTDDALYVTRGDEDVARRLPAEAWSDLEAKTSSGDR